MEPSVGDMRYACDNDDCWKKGKIQVVPRGKDADCPFCGWSMYPA